MNRYFVAGVLIGVLIAVIYRNLQAKPPPKPRGAKTQRLLDTKEIAQYYERIREDKPA